VASTTWTRPANCPARRKYIARPSEEIRFLLLKAVRCVTCLSTFTRNLERHVEEQRQVRLQTSLDPCFQYGNPFFGHTSSAALISEGGIGETVANDPRAARQSRPDDRGEVLRAGGEHEQRFRFRLHFLGEQQRAQSFTDRRSTRFASDQHFSALSA
jgi:hypothetical protein